MVLFNDEVLKIGLEELVKHIDSLLDDIAPEDKDNKDFTGGYIQQLKNSNVFVAYYGTKAGDNNRNKDTVRVDIQADELDMFYMMLKAKIHDMRNSGTKTVKVSMAQRILKEEDIF